VQLIKLKVITFCLFVPLMEKQWNLLNLLCTSDFDSRFAFDKAVAQGSETKIEMPRAYGV
jgi:hypothetical protein